MAWKKHHSQLSFTSIMFPLSCPHRRLHSFLLLLLSLLFILLLLSRRSPTPPDTYKYARHHFSANVCDRWRYPSNDSLLEDRLTVLVNGFSEVRLPLLRQNLFLLSRSNVVEAIYVLWGNVSTPQETLEAASWRSAGAEIHLIRQKSASLNDRFLPRAFIKTKAVLICDDDVSVGDRQLAFALNVWRENGGRRIVGFFPRAHSYLMSSRDWEYRKLPDRYSMVLTKLMLLHTDLLFQYTCHAPPGVKEYVDAATNCEDIAMNFLASRATGVGPLLVEGEPRDWGDMRNSEVGLSQGGLSARASHRGERGACLTAFRRLFRGMALRYSYSRASGNVTEASVCEKYGLLVACDARVQSRVQAQRALGLNVACSAERRAYATLIGSTDLLPAALVLAQSLRATGTPYDLVLMLDEGSDLDRRDPILTAHFDRVLKVKSLGGPQKGARGGFRVQGFNKLNCWLLEEYGTLVYLDVDTLVLTNLDHLFDHPEPSAVPDVYMSEKFNSGLLVLKPSKATYLDMLTKIDLLPSYNKGDQGFLNSYFSGWFQMPPAHRLPARYNAVFLFPPHYHPPSWFSSNHVADALGPIAMVHFAGPWHKPWRMNVSRSEIVWCDIWLRLSQALQANKWKPLDLEKFSMKSIVPSYLGYDEEYPQAFQGPVPLQVSKAQRRGPHRQVIPHLNQGSNEAVVTAVWDENTLSSVAVWATSYQQHHTFNSWRKTLLLVGSNLAEDKWQPLVRLFNFVRVVKPVVVPRLKNLSPEFLVLHAWDPVDGFDRLVFVHPLSLFTDNCNDLFRFRPFAAVPAVFPSDQFSSRVMVVQPDADLHEDLVAKLTMLTFPEESLDRYLNAYFFDWYQSSPLQRIPSCYGVDMWFKEGLMKFFSPWKILSFDTRAPPWVDISDWMAHDRTKAVKLWRRTFCSLETELRPEHLDDICGEVEL